MTENSDGHVASAPKGVEQSVGHGRPLVERCRCHRPLNPPDGRHWWPCRDPEPGPEVRVIVLHGDEPGFLRMVRVDGGRHGQGAAATYPELTPPKPWVATGRCWAGAEHPVVDLTRQIKPQRPALAVRSLP